MYLSKDKCEKCCNRNNCPYKVKYEDSIDAISEVLDRYKVVIQWYGSLTATCDYFVRDPSTEELSCCSGG